jgi:TPR repeat protein
MKHLVLLLISIVCFYCGAQAQTARDYLNEAEQENADAQYKLGICYFNGDGITNDLTRAVFQFMPEVEQKIIYQWIIAIKKGDATAQSDLNNYYKVKAGYYWKKAAEQNHAMAQYSLAKSLDNVTSLKIDLGLNPDGNTALYWYEEALKNGLEDDEKNLSETAIEQLKAAGYSSSKKKDKITVKSDIKTPIIIISYVLGFIICVLLSNLYNKKRITF